MNDGLNGNNDVAPMSESLRHDIESLDAAQRNVIKAADTVAETIALINNKLVENNPDEIDGHYGGSRPVIDIDDAKWQKDYVEKMERNFERIKKTAIYKQINEMGIIRDPNENVVDDENDEDGGIKWHEMKTLRGFRHNGIIHLEDGEM